MTVRPRCNKLGTRARVLANAIGARGGSMLRNIGTALLLGFLNAALGCSGGHVGSVNTAGGGSNSSGDPPSVGAVSIFPASETLRTGGQRRFSGWDSTVS